MGEAVKETGTRTRFQRPAEKRERMVRGFASLINCNSAENQSATPDFILGEYLMGCLETYERAVNQREAWSIPLKDEEQPEPPPTERETDVCHWCGLIRGDHYHSRPEGAPVSRMPCSGLRVGFLEKALALGVGSRFYHRRADLFGSVTAFGTLEGDAPGSPSSMAQVVYEYPHDGTPQVVPLAELESVQSSWSNRRPEPAASALVQTKDGKGII